MQRQQMPVRVRVSLFTFHLLAIQLLVAVVPMNAQTSDATLVRTWQPGRRYCTPGAGARDMGSTPKLRMTVSHIASAGVSNTIAGSGGAVSQADSASSVSSCPGPHPA